MSDFKERVEALVAEIPKGRVMTYGQIAALAGNARAARIVGGIAHFGNPDLPWQRVVNKSGGLANGYPGGKSGHKQVLEAEGIAVDENYRVDVERLLWRPKQQDSKNPSSILQPPTSKLPLVVIVGPTASGKSALAIELAKKFGGEIIAADSWTVRREVNIGTAKPSQEEQSQVKHHLLDIVNPCDDFTAAVFKDLALEAIEDIGSRGKLPIMVGGTGLYVDGVLFDYGFLPEGDREARQELNALSLKELLRRIESKGLDTDGIDTQNKRRLIRLLETGGAKPTRHDIRSNTLILGVKLPHEMLRKRITARVDAMIEAGLEPEVRELSKKYGWECEALKGIGYQEWREYFCDNQSLADTKMRIVKDTLQLAKRQNTWFKRNKSIHWIHDPSSGVDIVTTFLNKTPA
ncbi:MAG: tRNA (adenosine(37)-N6)-dimethylallyltransferase MiaA [Candidatus Saccharibacteria bacterium]|nr:tRNA (adenosine(37)-N6)-dimethylallyltransferase MiaA [Candidatus Saccharibacteria bacterium]